MFICFDIDSYWYDLYSLLNKPKYANTEPKSKQHDRLHAFDLLSYVDMKMLTILIGECMQHYALECFVISPSNQRVVIVVAYTKSAIKVSRFLYNSLSILPKECLHLLSAMNLLVSIFAISGIMVIAANL